MAIIFNVTKKLGIYHVEVRQSDIGRLSPDRLAMGGVELGEGGGAGTQLGFAEAV